MDGIGGGGGAEQGSEAAMKAGAPKLRPPREVVAAAIAAGIGIGAVLAVGAAGWPGEPIQCGSAPCYCEEPAHGFMRQPGNTWSNLGVVAVGLGLAMVAARRREQRNKLGAADPTLDVLGIAAPPTLVFQGVGSMFFHGGLTTWGGALDAMSMFCTAGLLLSAQGVRLGWFGVRGFVAAWVGLVALGLFLGFVDPPLSAMLVFLMFIGIVLSEVALSRLGRAKHPGLFRAGLVTHTSAITVWFLSAEPGQVLCAPSSVWQGHGLWHLTATASVTMMMLHVLRNMERPVPAPAPA